MILIYIYISYIKLFDKIQFDISRERERGNRIEIENIKYIFLYFCFLEKSSHILMVSYAYHIIIYHTPNYVIYVSYDIYICISLIIIIYILLYEVYNNG
jgi:hypothetical protein